MRPTAAPFLACAACAVAMLAFTPAVFVALGYSKKAPAIHHRIASVAPKQASANVPPSDVPSVAATKVSALSHGFGFTAMASLGAFCAAMERRKTGGAMVSAPSVQSARVQLRATQANTDVNYFELLTKGDLPKRLFIVAALLALARIGFYVPLYGFDADATAEYFARQATQNLGFVDQLFGGGLGRVSLFSLGIGPFITSSIVIQIWTTISPQLKGLAQGEEGEAGREKYKGYIKQLALFFAVLQGFGQATSLAPYVFDNGGLWTLEITAQLAAGAMFITFIGDWITDQKLGNGSSLLVFSSIVANLPRTFALTVATSQETSGGQGPALVFGASLLLTILGVVYVLSSERRIPILFAKRLQDEASGQAGTRDATESYLPIKLNASGVLPLIFAGSLLSLPALAANYTKQAWLADFAKELLPGSAAYIPCSMVLIGIFSFVSTFQVLDPKDMATNLRKQAAAIPGVRPGRETELYLRTVLERASLFGAVILAVLFVLPNGIEALTQLSTPNSFAGTSLLILVGVATDTWRQLQAELLMQQYATDVDRFYKGRGSS